MSRVRLPLGMFADLRRAVKAAGATRRPRCPRCGREVDPKDFDAHRAACALAGWPEEE